MVKPHSSNFRVITTNVLGVRKLRIITVCKYRYVEVVLHGAVSECWELCNIYQVVSGAGYSSLSFLKVSKVL